MLCELRYWWKISKIYFCYCCCCGKLLSFIASWSLWSCLGRLIWAQIHQLFNEYDKWIFAYNSVPIGSSLWHVHKLFLAYFHKLYGIAHENSLYQTNLTLIFYYKIGLYIRTYIISAYVISLYVWFEWFVKVWTLRCMNWLSMWMWLYVAEKTRNE
jgi:hypothetical protein